MDIRTLPAAEQDRYERLRTRYRLHFVRQQFGTISIRLLMPSDLEEVLAGRDPFADVSSFPFWACLWESAIVLARLLASMPVPDGSRLLELGAGLGAPGLTAAAAGHQLVLSDSDETILDFQRISSAANGLTDVQSVMFNWRQPPELGRFSVIVGAEILFREEFVEPLLGICKNYLQPGGTIYLAHDVRRKSLPLFLRAAERDFLIGTKKESVQRDNRRTDVLVNRLQLRSDASR